MGIAEPSLASLGNQIGCSIVVQVGEHFTCVGITNAGADWNLNLNIFCTLAVAATGASLLTRRSDKSPLVPEVVQRIERAVGDHDDIATISAISTIWATKRNVFLPAEVDEAVATLPSGDKDPYLVYEIVSHSDCRLGFAEDSDVLISPSGWCPSCEESKLGVRIESRQVPIRKMREAQRAWPASLSLKKKGRGSLPGPSPSDYIARRRRQPRAWLVEDFDFLVPNAPVDCLVAVWHE